MTFCKKLPVDPHIYVGSSRALSDEEIGALSEELSTQVGVYSFSDSKPALRLVSEPDCGIEAINRFQPCLSFVEIGTDIPYYGVGYERGSWHVLAAILEFLRHRFVDAVVVYGPDYTDDVEIVDQEFMDRMWAYWALNGCRPYEDKYGPSQNSEQVVPPKSDRAGG